jgi:hypothetical protein
MEIIYTYNDQQIIMPVPVMNVQAFSADEIFDKGLYFLIPFYTMRYESRFRKISDSEDPEYDKIYRELKDYFDRLLKACEVGVISENDTRNLAELSRIILKHIARKLDPDLRERMENLMGGHVLELQEDRWLKQGIELGKSEGVEIGLAQGRLEGIEQGRLEGSKFLLYSLVKDKLMDVSIAAKKDGSSVENFTKDMDAYFAKKGQQSDSDKKQ